MQLVGQAFDWDCGVACVAMALDLNQECMDVLREEVGTRSVWSVDLALLLHQRGVRCTLWSKALEVDSSYQE